MTGSRSALALYTASCHAGSEEGPRFCFSMKKNISFDISEINGKKLHPMFPDF